MAEELPRPRLPLTQAQKDYLQKAFDDLPLTDAERKEIMERVRNEPARRRGPDSSCMPCAYRVLQLRRDLHHHIDWLEGRAEFPVAFSDRAEEQIRTGWGELIADVGVAFDVCGIPASAARDYPSARVKEALLRFENGRQASTREGRERLMLESARELRVAWDAFYKVVREG